MCVIHLMRKWFECRTDKTTLVTSISTTCHNFWKKNGDIPLGPGDFEGCMLNKSFLTSFGV